MSMRKRERERVGKKNAQLCMVWLLSFVLAFKRSDDEKMISS